MTDCKRLHLKNKIFYHQHINHKNKKIKILLAKSENLLRVTQNRKLWRNMIAYVPM